MIDTTKRYFVTGGLGFIGSHLIERLYQTGCTFTVYDNLSTGNRAHMNLVNSARMTFIHADIRDSNRLNAALVGHDVVIHLAAYTETQESAKQRNADFDNGIVGTRNVLEAMMNQNVGTLLFASSQLVYGDLRDRPLTEETGPLLPISLYGASKLACEGLISAYAHLYGICAIIYRFTNIVGGRMWRGILHDFVQKLIIDPEHLEVLGNGKQSRNYLLVDYCIDAVLAAYAHQPLTRLAVYNVGNRDSITATHVAETVINEMELSGITEISYRGGEIGWAGDVPSVKYDISKISALGWKPKLTSEGSIREAVRRLLHEIAFFTD